MNSKIKLFISSLSISNVDYLLKKKVGRIVSLYMIEDFCTFCGILSVGEKEILQAFKHNIKDFEDSIPYQAALGNPEIKAIISRNVMDYKKSQIPVFSPEIFLSSFK
nr:PIN domain-containing protein [Algoriphagus sp.]